MRVINGIWYLPAGPQWRADVGQMIDADNLCTDLEFAIARGIDLVQALLRPFFHLHQLRLTQHFEML